MLNRVLYSLCRLECRFISSSSCSRKENAAISTTTKNDGDLEHEKQITKPEVSIPQGYRFMYPEFLPDPKMEWRNPIREKLERWDMIKRRTQIDIPEFYVGSVLAVTSSNPHATTKSSRFVGICIHKSGCGLRTRFVLRNVIDGLGTEICYNLYDPKILQYEVLRLEKRLDDELYYLRDAPAEYSTFPLDMEPEILPVGSAVPVNPIKIQLKPRPWVARWERKDLKGVDQEHLMTLISDKMKWQLTKHVTPWEKFDLMKQYRSTIPEEEQTAIFSEVHSELHKLEHDRKKTKRRRTFIKPSKSA